MQKKIRVQFLLSAVVAITLALSGCSSIRGITGGGTDNTPPPTQLKNISPAFQPKVVQSFSLKDDVYTYAQTNGKLYTASHQGTVSEYDLSSGKLLWQKDLDAPLVSSMGAFGNLVVLGSERGNIEALNSGNGKTLWKIALKSQLSASPAFVQDKIILKTLDGLVIALNANTGKILWQVNHGSPLMVLSAGSAPKILGDTAIVGFSDGKLCAYSISNGGLKWEIQIAQPTGATDVEQMIDIASNLQIDNGIVYTAAYQGNLAAVLASSGKTLWQTPVSAYKGLALDNGAIYLSDAQSALVKMNSTTGRTMFTQNDLKFRGLTAPVVTNNLLAVGDKEGYVHFVDLASGKILSRININEGAVIHLYAHNRSIDVLTRNGTVKKIQI